MLIETKLDTQDKAAFPGTSNVRNTADQIYLFSSDLDFHVLWFFGEWTYWRWVSEIELSSEE